jgi:2-oxoglutarate-Fe(II)-dependent oxygenase superfamily protein
MWPTGTVLAARARTAASDHRAVAVRLDELAAELGPVYRAAKPFPHIVIDGVFDESVLDGVLAEWPARDAVPWIKHDDDLERGKHTNGDIGRFGPNAQRVLTEISRPFFLEFLSELTGISALIPDPYFAAAGLFETTEGGYLDIHADFSINARTGLDRRCNVLIYLNRDWTDANGGQLELWRARPFRREHSIVPVFNRMVIFDTLPSAFHGHPNPVVSPPHGSRRAISAYYFTRGRPFREQLYGAQGVRAPGTAQVSRRAQLRAVGKAVTPPIVVEAAKTLARRRRP